MKLYYSPGACSLSPHIVLVESGLDFNLERVDLGAKKTEHGADYLAINAKGYVPALELEDGQLLTEGPAIVQYIADLAPQKALAPPAGTLARYRLQEWLNFVSTELHKGFSGLFNKRAPEEWKAIARETLASRFDFVARQLDGKPYLMDAGFSVADAYLFTIMRWAQPMAVTLSPWPVLGAYMERTAARPAVKSALAAEGLA